MTDNRDEWLDEWTPETPPRGFSDRVMERVALEGAAPTSERVRTLQPRRRFARVFAGVSAIALAASVAMFVRGGAPAEGQITADVRREVALGSRALAVLEDGAEVSWRGDDVTQKRGDVFYRVEKGKRFTVHTPAGDVAVLGTCFRVMLPKEGEAMNKRDGKMIGAGALASALALVIVYEGRVAVSHAQQSAIVNAGERANIGANGILVSGEANKAVDGALTTGGSDDPLAAANKNLVEQVSGYRSRLEAMEAEKKTVERRLVEAEKKLATEENGGKAPKSEWDFSKDEWAEMAKNGEFKMRMPCMRKDGWRPEADDIASLGLAPEDGETLRLASMKATESTYSQIRPYCAEILGSDELADKLADMCGNIVRRRIADGPKDAAKDAQRVVAEMRAGQRPLPGPNEKVDPLVATLLAESGAIGVFESELAKSMGPSEAHRIAYADALCANHSHFSSGPLFPKKIGGPPRR